MRHYGRCAEARCLRCALLPLLMARSDYAARRALMRRAGALLRD